MLHASFELNAQTGARVDCYLLDGAPLGREARGAVLVCPGGAYLETVDHEAEPIAVRFNALGLHAAVVRYSCGRDARWPQPALELARAVALLRERAEEWRVDPRHIAVCGFSAGGHLCAMLSTRYERAAQRLGLRAEEVRPDCAILGYPVTDLNIPWPDEELRGMMYEALTGETEPERAALDAIDPVRHVSGASVPGFVWTTANDDLVPASNSLNYASALWAAGVPCELHMFADGPHGLSLADATVAREPAGVDPIVGKWFELAAGWLKKRGFLP